MIFNFFFSFNPIFLPYSRFSMFYYTFSLELSDVRLANGEILKTVRKGIFHKICYSNVI